MDEPRPGTGPVPHNLAGAAWPAVAQARYEVALLPWGATEAHNRHLPYGTDTIQSEAVAEAAASAAARAGARVVLLPAVPFGVNTDDTGVGDPRAATAQKGRAYFEAVTQQLGEFLVELASADGDRMYE